MSERPADSRLIDGRAVASRLLAEVKQRVETLRAATGTAPCLATVLVGDDPASATYVRMKRNRCKELVLDSRLVEVRAASTTAQVVDVVAGLSLDRSVHGILVQHPMPGHVDERAVFEAITPGKDVDGVTMRSFAAMAFGGEGFASCTPAGILRLLDAYEVDLEGLHAVVVGRSPILGKPVGMLLLSRNATVTYCHSRTVRLDEMVADSDLVVAAVGVPELIKGSWIKPGAVVIDAGYNSGNVGDVEFATAVQRARLITPVPGGVGPTTIAVLLEQTVTAAERVMELPI
jgi:methylenetetrahydrofolate dehydrogenase (NADP+)/methenyltetrahydrofolate cyclohydrolase